MMWYAPDGSGHTWHRPDRLLAAITTAVLAVALIAVTARALQGADPHGGHVSFR